MNLLFGEFLEVLAFGGGSVWLFEKVEGRVNTSLRHFWIRPVLDCNGFGLHQFWISTVLKRGSFGLQQFWITAKVSSD